jgi:hypothetical protein
MFQLWRLYGIEYKVVYEQWLDKGVKGNGGDSKKSLINLQLDGNWDHSKIQDLVNRKQNASQAKVKFSNRNILRL